MYEYEYARYASTDPTAFIVISIIIALVCAILCFVMVLPESKRHTLNKFFRVVADIFNFKHLLLEVILKFLYVFTTIFVIVMGFFMMFMQEYGQSLALVGFLVMILGPVALRITYEFLIMAILLVKNTIEINKKLSYPAKNKVVEEIPVQYTENEYTAPVYEDSAEEINICKNCGAPIVSDDSAFCANCGYKL